ILNNAGAVMLYGGTKDPEDLKAWESLAGERDEVVKTRNSEGKVTSTSVRKTPVLASAQLAALPEFRVVVFSDMPPAVGRVQPVWKRRGWAQAPLPAPALALPAPAPTPAPAPAGAVPAQALTDAPHSPGHPPGGRQHSHRGGARPAGGHPRRDDREAGRRRHPAPRVAHRQPSVVAARRRRRRRPAGGGGGPPPVARRRVPAVPGGGPPPVLGLPPGGGGGAAGAAGGAPRGAGGCGVGHPVGGLAQHVPAGGREADPRVRGDLRPG